MTDPKATPILRKRPSSLKNNECQWRVVLKQDELGVWKYRKSLNPNTSEHNHEIAYSMTDDIWPQEVINKIIQLSRQKKSTDDEIREIIKLQFPDITWNDRRFLNYLMEERKRTKQKEITERVQKLISASTKLCSVVAANEDWASCVETDLAKMLDNYRQRTRVSNQSLDSMVDLQLDLIHSEIDKMRKNPSLDPLLPNSTKKRKMFGGIHHVDGVQIMSIPSCTLYIRSQPLRSLSEPSSQNRRALADLITPSSQQQQLNSSFGTVFNLTSPISSPSSTSSIQQRIDYGYNRNDMLQSPPIPDSSGNIVMSSNYYPMHPSSFSPYQQQQPQQHSNPNYSTSGSGGGSGGGGGGNNGGGSGNPGGNQDVGFNFEPATTYSQLTTPSSAPILIHRHSNNERMSFSNNQMGYYTSSPIGRENSSSSNSNSIQQRMMMQQEYEQQRHLLDSGGNVHLPTIRTSANTLMVQQHQHHHMNSTQQNWS